MICSRCQKRPAVVFVSTNKNDNEPRGYCLLCAKELGIKPVEDIIKRMGISPDDLESVQEQMDSIMENMGDMGDMSEIAQNMGLQNVSQDQDNNNNDNEEEDFTPGGAPSFPNFFNMFGGNAAKTQSDGDKKPKDKKQKNRKHINLYCEDLTRKARTGAIDRVVGRDKEIERVIQILSRRTKNNPCLIGEPGVGKTAIAEGLALRIAQGNVPHRLKDKEIQLLDLTALIAGTQFRGQYESRIKGLTKEVKEAGNIIRFIDEVHNLVGGGDSEGTMNAA
ncbi:MAG: ATP-dependent Clp protease ATP-binding subunit, partial [Ruminococcus sp.]|nr:ATP-dependent Clp protease ATP-binding subunit [Ruminococcus sp.]